MITKRSGIENHSCVDFLKGEVSKLKQVIQLKDEKIDDQEQELDYFREQLGKEDLKNPDFYYDYKSRGFQCFDDFY